MIFQPKSLFWLRALCGLAVGLLVGVVMLAAFVQWRLARYLRGEQFRRLISEQTSAALGVQGDYLPLQWAGMTAYSDGFYGRGLQDSPIREVRADQIRASFGLSGRFRTRWRIGNVQIGRLHLKVSLAGQSLSKPEEKKPAAGAKRHLLVPLLVQEANIEWSTSCGSTGTLQRTKMEVTPNRNFLDCELRGGDLRLTDLPPLQVEEAKIRVHKDQASLRESRLQLADGGRLIVNGQIGRDAATELDLNVHFEDVPLHRWLPTDWRGRLIGLAHGEARLSGRMGVAGASRSEGRIELSNARLEALPMLNRLAVFTGSEQFRQLQLQKARADYWWRNGQLVVERILLESVGLLRLEGRFTLENDIVNGEFDVGVASSVLRWLPGARSRVFTIERDGYRWTKMRVQGPTNDLQENLSGRLLAAASAEAIETTKEALQKGAEALLGIFHKLTQ
ncbi:MAG: hypothetical protein N3B01_06010 [Verrucomicrobiae bacterium]|nr:hypothetical protein [Verrucomicrobiae bacterium]